MTSTPLLPSPIETVPMTRPVLARRTRQAHTILVDLLGAPVLSTDGYTVYEVDAVTTISVSATWNKRHGHGALSIRVRYYDRDVEALALLNPAEADVEATVLAAADLDAR